MGDHKTRLYRKGVLEAEGFPVADVSEYLEQPDTVVWVDFCGPSKEQLHELAAELGLHELAVEDALGPHQRPKLDRYATHLFLSCHAVRVDVEGGDPRRDRDRRVHQRTMADHRAQERRLLDGSRARALGSLSRPRVVHGVSFLLYGLLDVIVDSYFDSVQAFDEYYEEVSDGIFADRPLDPAQQRHWFDMRRAMVRFHRLVVPMREAISSLMRREHSAVSEQLYPYFQDVYDHILRVTESSDSLRELVSTIVETNLSLRDYRQNQIVKKVSSWAAIIAVPALITGFYGMNVPYPGFQQHSGVVVSIVLMVGTCVGLYAVFRRIDWL